MQPDRFTIKSQEAISAAGSLAERRRNPQITPEHLLVVLLEQDAGAFSVPSKTLSYLCAGRPVLGLMPAENLAATLVAQVDGCVLPPNESSLPEAAAWVREVLTDDERRVRLGKSARALAEREFALTTCADSFEGILAGAAGRAPAYA